MKNTFRISLLLIAGTMIFSSSSHAETAQISGLTSESTSAIKHLADRYTDGAKGYSDAADRINDQGLKAIFTKRAEQRKEYRRELLNKAGITDESKGSFEGSIHRAWLNLKGAVTDENDTAVMSSIRSGEEEAVKSFTNLLGQPLPEDVRSTIQDQYKEVFGSYKWASDEIMKQNDKDHDLDMDEAEDKAEAKVEKAKNKADNALDRAGNKAENAKDKAKNALNM